MCVSDVTMRCPSTPQAEKADILYQGSLDGGVSTLQCHLGHRFPDGRIVRQLLCQHGAWNESEVPACSGQWLCMYLYGIESNALYGVEYIIMLNTLKSL